jgi:ABC-type glycerol-3-phosphate transport system substrate-binding protein
VAVKRGDPSKPFVQGGAAFWLQPGWAVSDLRDVTSFKWGMAPLPWKTTNKSVSFTDCVLITKDTRALDASWELVKYLTGKDGQIEYSKATGRPPTRTDAFDPWLDVTLQLPGIAIKSRDQLRSLATGYLGNHIDNWAHYVVNAAPLQAIMTETETKFLTGELGVPAAMIEVKQRMDTQLRETYEQFKSTPLVRDTPCT